MTLDIFFILKLYYKDNITHAQYSILSGRYNTAIVQRVMAFRMVTKFVLRHSHVLHSAVHERSLTLPLSGRERQVRR